MAQPPIYRPQGTTLPTECRRSWLKAVSDDNHHVMKSLYEAWGAALVDSPLLLSEGREQCALLHCATIGALSTVKCLVQDCHAALDIRNQWGATAIHQAAKGDSVPVLDYLARCAPSMVNAPDLNGATPLYIATQQHCFSVVQFLVQLRADTEAANTDGYTPLIVACFDGSMDIIRCLVQEGHASIHALRQRGHGLSPIAAACTQGRQQAVELLLQYGANLHDTANPDRGTPLHIAAARGHAQLARFLALEKGADLFAKNASGYTPLMNAIHAGHAPIVKMFIQEAGISPNQRDSYGHTPLHMACWRGAFEIVKFLLDECGCSIESRNLYDETPMFGAVIENKTDIIRDLLQRGADIDARNNIGWTPFYIACDKGIESLCKLLLNVGRANPNIVTSNGSTPLIVACLRHHCHIIRFLVNDARVDGREAALQAALAAGDFPVAVALASGQCDRVIETLPGWHSERLDLLEKYLTDAAKANNRTGVKLALGFYGPYRAGMVLEAPLPAAAKNDSWNCVEELLTNPFYQFGSMDDRFIFDASDSAAQQLSARFPAWYRDHPVPTGANISHARIGLSNAVLPSLPALWQLVPSPSTLRCVKLQVLQVDWAILPLSLTTVHLEECASLTSPALLDTLVSRTPHLTALSLRRCDLTELPATLQRMAHLVNLELQDNPQLQLMQATVEAGSVVAKLPFPSCLQRLSLSGCTTLGQDPAPLVALSVSCPALEYLDVSHCNLTWIPAELAVLPQMVSLTCVEGNALQPAPTEADPHSTLAFYRAHSTIPIPVARMFVVGPAFEGKSTFLNALAAHDPSVSPLEALPMTAVPLAHRTRGVSHRILRLYGSRPWLLHWKALMEVHRRNAGVPYSARTVQPLTLVTSECGAHPADATLVQHMISSCLPHTGEEAAESRPLFVLTMSLVEPETDPADRLHPWFDWLRFSCPGATIMLVGTQLDRTTPDAAKMKLASWLSVFHGWSRACQDETCHHLAAAIAASRSASNMETAAANVDAIQRLQWLRDHPPCIAGMAAFSSFTGQSIVAKTVQPASGLTPASLDWAESRDGRAGLSALVDGLVRAAIMRVPHLHTEFPTAWAALIGAAMDTHRCGAGLESPGSSATATIHDTAVPSVLLQQFRFNAVVPLTHISSHRLWRRSLCWNQSSESLGFALQAVRLAERLGVLMLYNPVNHRVTAAPASTMCILAPEWFTAKATALMCHLKPELSVQVLDTADQPSAALDDVAFPVRLQLRSADSNSTEPLQVVPVTFRQILDHAVVGVEAPARPTDLWGMRGRSIRHRQRALQQYLGSLIQQAEVHARGIRTPLGLTNALVRDKLRAGVSMAPSDRSAIDALLQEPPDNAYTDMARRSIRSGRVPWQLATWLWGLESQTGASAVAFQLCSGWSLCSGDPGGELVVPSLLPAAEAAAAVTVNCWWPALISPGVPILTVREPPMIMRRRFRLPSVPAFFFSTLLCRVLREASSDSKIEQAYNGVACMFCPTTQERVLFMIRGPHAERPSRVVHGCGVLDILGWYASGVTDQSHCQGWMLFQLTRHAVLKVLDQYWPGVPSASECVPVAASVKPSDNVEFVPVERCLSGTTGSHCVSPSGLSLLLPPSVFAAGGRFLMIEGGIPDSAGFVAAIDLHDPAGPHVRIRTGSAAWRFAVVQVAGTVGVHHHMLVPIAHGALHRLHRRMREEDTDFVVVHGYAGTLADIQARGEAIDWHAIVASMLRACSWLEERGFCSTQNIMQSCVFTDRQHWRLVPDGTLRSVDEVAVASGASVSALHATMWCGLGCLALAVLAQVPVYWGSASDITQALNRVASDRRVQFCYACFGSSRLRSTSPAGTENTTQLSLTKLLADVSGDADLPAADPASLDLNSDLIRQLERTAQCLDVISSGIAGLESCLQSAPTLQRLLHAYMAAFRIHWLALVAAADCARAGLSVSTLQALHEACDWDESETTDVIQSLASRILCRAASDISADEAAVQALCAFGGNLANRLKMASLVAERTCYAKRSIITSLQRPEDAENVTGLREQVAGTGPTLAWIELARTTALEVARYVQSAEFSVEDATVRGPADLSRLASAAVARIAPDLLTVFDEDMLGIPAGAIVPDTIPDSEAGWQEGELRYLDLGSVWSTGCSEWARRWVRVSPGQLWVSTSPRSWDVAFAIDASTAVTRNVAQGILGPAFQVSWMGQSLVFGGRDQAGVDRWVDNVFSAATATPTSSSW